MNDPKLILGQQPQLSPVVHQVGMSPAFIGCSMFCANCWPKQIPAFIIWDGFSLCHQCVTPLRRQVDWTGELRNQGFPPIAKRDAKEVWGEPKEESK